MWNTALMHTARVGPGCKEEKAVDTLSAQQSDPLELHVKTAVQEHVAYNIK